MTDIQKVQETLTKAIKNIGVTIIRVDNGYLSDEVESEVNSKTIPELIGDYLLAERQLMEEMMISQIWEPGGEFEAKVLEKARSTPTFEVMGLFLLLCLPWFKTHGGFKEGPQWFPKEGPAAKYNRELLRYLREKLK